MSKNITISLTDDVAELLKNRRKNDIGFNFSKFIQNALESDILNLKAEEVQRKIRESELLIQKHQKEVEYLTDILPTIEENDKIKKDNKQKVIGNAIECIKRTIKKDIGEFEVTRIAKVHQKLTGVDYNELIEIARE